MNYGEIYWVSLPDRGGREQRGRRPAVIWQDMQAFPLPTIVIIPLTGQAKAMRFDGFLTIDPTPANGLASSSVALVFQLGSCDARRFEGRIGQLDDIDLIRMQDLAKKLQKLG